MKFVKFKDTCVGNWSGCCWRTCWGLVWNWWMLWWSFGFGFGGGDVVKRFRMSEQNRKIGKPRRRIWDRSISSKKARTGMMTECWNVYQAAFDVVFICYFISRKTGQGQLLFRSSLRAHGTLEQQDHTQSRNLLDKRFIELLYKFTGYNNVYFYVLKIFFKNIFEKI